MFSGNKMTLQDDPVIKRFRAAIDDVYGDRAARVLLFGSRARGDSRPDSDYDVAVFLKDYGGLWNELGKIAPIVFDLGAEMDAFVSVKPLPEADYDNHTLFMGEVRREGIPL